MRVPTATTVWDVVQPGTRVIINEGVLPGLRGTVLGFDETRVTLTVQLLEGPIIAFIDAGWVRLQRPFDATLPLLTH
jgi:hypothetical protein